MKIENKGIHRTEFLQKQPWQLARRRKRSHCISIETDSTASDGNKLQGECSRGAHHLRLAWRPIWLPPGLQTQRRRAAAGLRVPCAPHCHPVHPNDEAQSAAGALFHCIQACGKVLVHLLTSKLQHLWQHIAWLRHCRHALDDHTQHGWADQIMGAWQQGILLRAEGKLLQQLLTEGLLLVLLLAMRTVQRLLHLLWALMLASLAA